MTPRPATLTINRAPVLTLWAAVVAERLGFSRDEALTLGKSLAGLNAQTKGRRLGLFTAGGKAGAAKNYHARGTGKAAEGKAAPDEALGVDLMDRAIPAIGTPEGVRALHDGKPMTPESVERYLESKFGESLGAVREAFEALAASLPPADLATRAFGLYEAFRPEIPAGTRGWGAKGVLDLERVRALAAPKKRAK